MGGNLGCHRSIPRDPSDLCHHAQQQQRCRGLVGVALGKRKQRKFSAACNFTHILVNQERLNINLATEEELMTLPGVNRAVAVSIVQYRDCIGGFKKVEDLALVSGVGATKLEAIKLEICVSSRTSSSNHSPSSLRRDAWDQPAPTQSQLCFFSGGGVNINTASPAQLQSVRGISEKVALSIVAYRAERGAFRSVEDLVRVEHINGALLDKIRFHVFVERSRTPSTNTTHNPTHTRSSSHPSPTSFSSLHSDDLVEPLPPGGPTQMASSRRPVDPPPPQPRGGSAVVRLATWNLQRCSCDKANNPGVREVVCMTLLENDIKLLAVQDLVDREALDKFCVELNQATLASVRRWKTPRGVWKSVVSEEHNQGSSYCGFLWDSSCGIDLKDAAILESTVVNGNAGPAPRPYLARFLIGSSEVTLVNVHMAPPVQSGETTGANGKTHVSNDQSASHQRLAPCIQETLRGHKDLVVLGDFGGFPPSSSSSSSSLDILRKEKLCALVPATQNTNISTRCPLGSASLDNIWVSRSLKKSFTGHCAVVREGLTNPWIPDNWSWGGVASDHCPVVAEFFTTDPPQHRGPPRDPPQHRGPPRDPPLLLHKDPKEPPPHKATKDSLHKDPPQHKGPPRDPLHLHKDPKELSRSGVAVVDRGDAVPKHER